MRAAYERFDQDIPDSLWPPEFIDGAQAWYNAFWDLSTDRQMGMQEGRIRYSAARAYGVHEDEFDEFWRAMKAMDNVYLQHASNGGEPKTFTREMFRGGGKKKG